MDIKKLISATEKVLFRKLMIFLLSLCLVSCSTPLPKPNTAASDDLLSSSQDRVTTYEKAEYMLEKLFIEEKITRQNYEKEKTKIDDLIKAEREYQEKLRAGKPIPTGTTEFLANAARTTVVAIGTATMYLIVFMAKSCRSFSVK